MMLAFFCCLSAGPYIIIENYGNWKTLSVASKSAYITGLWDSYIAFSGDDIITKDNTICSEGSIARVSDLVELIDSLYEKEINRGFSPANLLREKSLKHICKN